MISDSEKEQIKARLKELDAPLTVKLVQTSDARSQAIKAFCEQLCDLDPGIACSEADTDMAEIPAIELAANIHFAGVPSDNELRPFLSILAATTSAPELPANLLDRLDTVRLPATVELYVSPFCHHCPDLVEKLFPLAWLNPLIRLQIIDAAMFDDLSRSKRIKSVPTVIIDDVFRSTGQVKMEEVLAFLQERHPASLGAATMESILKEGDAAKLAGMMAAEREVFPAFLEVLMHPKWPVRLGAMVALEELAGLQPDLANEVIDTLWAEFDQVSDRVKGEIVYITGEIGSPHAFERITSIKSGKQAPEVCEAAIDALQALQDQKSSSDR